MEGKLRSAAQQPGNSTALYQSLGVGRRGDRPDDATRPFGDIPRLNNKVFTKTDGQAAEVRRCSGRWKLGVREARTHNPPVATNNRRRVKTRRNTRRNTIGAWFGRSDTCRRRWNPPQGNISKSWLVRLCWFVRAIHLRTREARLRARLATHHLSRKQVLLRVYGYYAWIKSLTRKKKKKGVIGREHEIWSA